MPSKQNTFNGYLVAGILFPTLTVTAIRFIFTNSLFASGLARDLAAKCSAVGSPYLHQFSGLPAVDRLVCSYVALFHAVLEPISTPIMQYFSTVGVISVFMAVEAYRRDRPILLAFPMTVALLGQSITFGLATTVYWGLFIWSGAASRTSHYNTQVAQGDAEAIIFSAVFGSIFPSIAFNEMKNPAVTALWQIFPAYVALLHMAYTSIRSPAKHAQSGFKTIRIYYIIMLLFNTSEHIRLFGFLNFSTLAATFTPSATPLPLTASLLEKADEFFRWDMIFVFVSSILATLWFARDAIEGLKIAAWHAVAVPLIGSGASLAAVFLWRESRLNGGDVGAPSTPRAKST